MPLYDPNLTLIDIIETVALYSPNKAAVLFNDEILTYNQLNQLADAFAAQLLELGVSKNSAVAISMERSTALMVAILGIFKSGATYVPLDPSYPAERVQFILQDTKAILITAPNSNAVNLNIQSEYEARAFDIKQNEQAYYYSFLTPKNSESVEENLLTDIAYIIYTSGSTGKPKGVMVSKQNIAHAVQDWATYFKDPIGTFILLPSVAFDSSIMSIFWTWTTAGTLLVPPQNAEKEPDKIKQLIAQYQVSDLLCLPTLYNLLIETNKYRLHSLKRVLVAGEVCSMALVQKHYAMLPACKLYNGYGPTEATVHATTFLVPNDYRSNSVSIGKPLPGTYIYLLDENRDIVMYGEEGEIYIGGNSVTQGYLNKPELTAAAFIQNPFSKGVLYKTGDMAKYLPDGNLLFIGRNDRQV